MGRTDDYEIGKSGSFSKTKRGMLPSCCNWSLKHHSYPSFLKMRSTECPPGYDDLLNHSLRTHLKSSMAYPGDNSGILQSLQAHIVYFGFISCETYIGKTPTPVHVSILFDVLFDWEGSRSIATIRASTSTVWYSTRLIRASAKPMVDHAKRKEKNEQRRNRRLRGDTKERERNSYAEEKRTYCKDWDRKRLEQRLIR